MVVGIYRNEPSFSAGMNSLPSPGKIRLAVVLCDSEPGNHENAVANPSQIVIPSAISTAGNTITTVLCRKHQPSMGA